MFRDWWRQREGAGGAHTEGSILEVEDRKIFGREDRAFCQNGVSKAEVDLDGKEKQKI